MSSQNDKSISVPASDYTQTVDDQAVKNGVAVTTVIASKTTSKANVPGSTASVANAVGYTFPSFPFGGMKRSAATATP